MSNGFNLGEISHSVTIENGVKTIGKMCFESCISLREITFPESVEKIGDGIIKGCINLEKVTFLCHLSGMDKSAFTDCDKLQEIVLRTDEQRENIDKLVKNIHRRYCSHVSEYVKNLRGINMAFKLGCSRQYKNLYEDYLVSYGEKIGKALMDINDMDSLRRYENYIINGDTLDKLREYSLAKRLIPFTAYFLSFKREEDDWE